MNQKALLLTIVSGLAACGGGGGGGTSTPAITMSECYELTNGNEFTFTSTPSVASYTYSGSTAASTYLSSTSKFKIQTDIYNGKLVQSLLNTVTSSAASISTVVTENATDYYEVTNTKSSFLGGNSSTTFSSTQSPYTSIYTNTGSIDLTLQPNQSASYDTVLKTTTSNSSTISTKTDTTTIRFIGLEDVKTMAGTFKNACKISYTNTSKSDQAGVAQITTTGTRWVSKGFGIVKSISTNVYSDGRIPSSNSYNREVSAVTKGSF